METAFDGKPIMVNRYWVASSPFTNDTLSPVWFFVKGGCEFTFTGVFDKAKITFQKFPYHFVGSGKFLTPIMDTTGHAGILPSEGIISIEEPTEKLVRFQISNAGASTSINVFYEVFASEG